MKIIYNENPLNTKIELDEHENKELWYKIKIEEMENLLFEAYCHLGRDNNDGITFEQDLDRVAHEVDYNYYMAKQKEKTPLENRVDELHKYILEDLKSPHSGDCTCVPCSCGKCYAEDLLGINTIKGLGKHQANMILQAFGETYKNKWKRQRNIDEAIEYLNNYDPKADWSCWEQHIDRWRKEAADAAEWLTKYRDEHFKH